MVEESDFKNSIVVADSSSSFTIFGSVIVSPGYIRLSVL